MTLRGCLATDSSFTEFRSDATTLMDCEASIALC
jgi:hypothetical protein